MNKVIRFDSIIKTYKLNEAPKEYVEQFYFDGEFFKDLDSILKYCKRNNVELPQKVSGTKKVKFDFDLLTWLETLMNPDDENKESIKCSIDINKLNKIQTDIDDLLKNVYVYQRLYNVMIDLKEENGFND